MVRNPLIPAFSASIRWASLPKAVIMMMGMDNFSSWRMRLAVSMPSMSGMRQSIMINSTGLLRIGLSFSRLRASAPEDWLSTRNPRDSSILRMIMRLSARSSTTRMLSPWMSGGTTRTVADGAAGNPSLTVKRKVLPSPSWLSAPISPFIRVTNCLQMLNPNPVPSYLRVEEVSAWLKGSNSSWMYSGSMPVPVSLTEKARVTVHRPWTVPSPQFLPPKGSRRPHR